MASKHLGRVDRVCGHPGGVAFVRSRSCRFSDSVVLTCPDHLRSIDWAKDDWAVKNRVTNSEAEPQASDLFGRKKYLRWRPKCPQGGQYALGRLGEKPRCSWPGHGSDYGDVQVCDESGAALAGATVMIRGEPKNPVPWEFRSTVTGTNGVAYVCFNIVRANDVAAFKAGYATNSARLVATWPVKLVLKTLPQ